MPRVDKIGLAFETYYVYILANKNNTVLYVGVTSDLINRCLEHRQKSHPDSFTARYNVNKLVYYEEFGNIDYAIWREKQIKSGSKSKKIKLIEAMNPRWNDLFETRLGTEFS